MSDWVLATEDELSEAVGLRLIQECSASSSAQPRLLRKNGSGYLRAKMKSFREMARRQAVLILTDLDQKTCPGLLLDDWLGNSRGGLDKLLLRVAVRETEAWLLADHEGMMQLLGEKIRLPSVSDELDDPKRYLLEQAKRAPKEVRLDLLPAKGAVASQGLGYNSRLVAWVSEVWSPQRAQACSPSLNRTRRRLRAVALQLQAGEAKPTC